MSTGILFVRAGLTNYVLPKFHLGHGNNPNHPLIAFLQRRGSQLHPESKDENNGVYMTCRHTTVWRDGLVSVVIAIVLRWKVLILSASSRRPYGFLPATGLASTFSPLTCPPSSTTWNTRQSPSFKISFDGFSVASFVPQLYLFSSNLPDDDVPCRLFVFTPTAWIEAGNMSSCSWALYAGGFGPHGNGTSAWWKQPRPDGWLWPKISDYILLYKTTLNWLVQC